MRRTRVTAVVGALAVGSGLLAGCTQSAEDEAACEAVQAEFDWATPARDAEERFDLTGPGWIAGDSTYSVRLPDGPVLWLFSDSFIGEVTSSGEPKPGMTMIHNALVAEDSSGQLTTYTSPGPEAFFRHPGQDTYYWVQDAKVRGEDELIVFLSLTRDKGQQGIDGFEWVRNAVATVSLPDLEVTGIENFTPGPDADHVAWGAGLLVTPTHTHIYGVEDRGDVKHLHLARAKAGHLADRSSWEYYGANGWTEDPAGSTRLTKGVANELSVTPYRDGYLMISSDTSEPFSPRINAWTACSPAGPWENPQTIYETPESENEGLFTYNAHGHPEISEDGSLLISYNVNTFDFSRLTTDPTLYRPSFITLDLE